MTQDCPYPPWLARAFPLLNRHYTYMNWQAIRNIRRNNWKKKRAERSCHWRGHSGEPRIFSGLALIPVHRKIAATAYLSEHESSPDWGLFHTVKKMWFQRALMSEGLVTSPAIFPLLVTGMELILLESMRSTTSSIPAPSSTLITGLVMMSRTRRFRIR